MQEQRIIVYLISKIKPNDAELKAHEFNVKEFCQVCGLDYDSGSCYQNVKETIRKLSTKNNWIKSVDENGKQREDLFFWITKASIFKDDGTIIMKLHESVEPYLVQLKKNFTQFGLIYTLGMNSRYSIRLYEILKSYENIHNKGFHLSELKELLMCENNASYENFAHFKIKVLDVAISEINNLTDIYVEYTTGKTGKKVTYIDFTIKSKKSNAEKLLAATRVEKILDSPKK
jgi:plasmid replication initiation protein